MVANKKMGRPTNDPKNIQTRIRMTQDQANMLNECSERLRLTKTDVLMNGLELVYKGLPNK